MVDSYKEILDISYSATNNVLDIQVVLLENFSFPEEIKDKIKQSIPNYEININEVLLTKEQFNENIDDWSPKYYKWLDFLLFYKAKAS